jgi:hypothetical protein
MDKPVRVQLSRQKGWRMPSNTVKVDRATKWGNPWRVVQMGKFLDTGGIAWAGRHDHEVNYPMLRTERDASQRAVTEFRCFVEGGRWHDLAPLRGKNLACWCKAGSPCHADVLLELANAPAQPPGAET